MGNDEATVIFGVLSLVETVAILYVVWILGIKTLRKRINRADAFYKAVVKSHGLQSFDQIMRTHNGNYAGAVDDNMTLDLMVKKYHDTPLKTLEDTNSHYGSYSLDATELQNRDNRFAYYRDTGKLSDDEIERRELAHKTARLAALQRVLRRRNAATQAEESD